MPSIRCFFLAFLLAAPSARAELYRWVDPETGSVKFSSSPPERRGVKFETLRYEAAPTLPAAASGRPPAPKPALETRWRSLLQELGALPERADFDRSGEGLRQQVEAYRAVAGELDRLDPAGAARRRTEESGILERLRKGLETQFNPKPPVQK